MIEAGPGGVVQAVKNPFADYLQLGVFISYEFVMNNFLYMHNLDGE